LLNVPGDAEKQQCFDSTKPKFFVKICHFSIYGEKNSFEKKFLGGDTEQK
jgi:hypothetical protein